MAVPISYTSVVDDRRAGGGGQVAVIAAVLVAIVLIGLGTVTWLVATEEPDILLVGDSIMRQTGPELDRVLPDQEIDNRGVNGSGLLNPQVYDWVERLPSLLARDRPEATVVLFIGNYAVEGEWWTDRAGNPVPPNTEAFFAEWRAEAEKVVRLLEDAGTDIYWVLPPPVLSPEGTETVNGLRAVYRDLASAHPSVTLVDAAVPLGDDTGAFIGETTASDGSVVVLRSGDGVHLAEGGARRLAVHLAEAIVEGSLS